MFQKSLSRMLLQNIQEFQYEEFRTVCPAEKMKYFGKN